MTVSVLLRSAAAAALFAGAFAAPAQAASMIGNSITARYYFPDSATVYGGFTVSPSGTFIVGAGVDATGAVDGFQQTFDFGASSFTLTFLSGVGFNFASFNGWQFLNNTKAFGAITSVTGIDASRVTVAGSTLGLNWQGVSFNTGDQITVNFDVVPEPQSWALLIAGFGLVGATMRRRAALAA